MKYLDSVKFDQIFFGLGEIEKTDIAPKLGQNGILQTFLKALFETTWSSEDILL